MDNPYTGTFVTKDLKTMHNIFHCPDNYKMCKTLWPNVKDSCPEALYEDIMSMDITHRVVILLIRWQSGSHFSRHVEVYPSDICVKNKELM